jgi:hypothetical protein
MKALDGTQSVCVQTVELYKRARLSATDWQIAPRESSVKLLQDVALPGDVISGLSRPSWVGPTLLKLAMLSYRASL